MVSIKLAGGLSNQIFMQSFIYSYAKKYGLDYCVHTKVHNPHIDDPSVLKLDAYRFPGINYCNDDLSLPIYNEKHYHYEEIQKMDNVCFCGFYQSWRYFDEYRNDLLKVLGFDDIKTKENVCGIHIRRGDYLAYPLHHPVVTPVYLTKAIMHMTSKGYTKFKVFSDGMEWCKEFFGNVILFGDLEFEFSEGKTEMEDLRELSSCESQICSNSTFSFFGAYINPNPKKEIVMPFTWFGESLQHDTKDLYLPQAIII